MQTNSFSQYRHIPYAPQIALLAANFIPLLGVVFLGWQVSTILAIYWAETGVIGVYAILRILYADAKEEKGPDGVVAKIQSSSLGTLLLIVFLVFHFGMFMLVHGIFLVTLFSQVLESAGQFNFSGVLIGIVSLFVSHGISFYRNYLQSEEYSEISANELMSQPYSRVMVMHFVIILSMFGMQFFGSFQQAALIILVVMKMIADIRAHIKEHARLQSAH